MFTAFSTALSGLNSNITAIDVTGNNLANLNTTGFKSSEVSFSDLMSQSLGQNTQIGTGVGQPATLVQFTQGGLQTTSSPLDAAIQGQGFFMVQNSQGSTEYTRAGSFQVDANGFLTTPAGEQVQGWSATNGTVNTNTPPGPISVPSGGLSTPQATANVSFNMNLDGVASAGPPAATFSTSVQVYDSLGQSHLLTVDLTKNSAAGQWDYSISVPNSDVTNGFTPVTGSLNFDSNGNLTTPAATSAPPQIQIQGLSDGAADMTLNWNLYNGTTPLITDFAQPSAVSSVSQDGLAASTLTQVSIGDNGQLTAQYANGQTLTVGQLAMALIRNPQSLLAVGDNSFRASGQTALPAVGTPGTGGRGSVVGGSLESSTADIAKEFTNLIIFQRGYEANAKVVTTVDQLSQDTLALKSA